MKKEQKTAILAGTGVGIIALSITLASLVLASCNNQKETTIPVISINDSSEENPVDTSEETTEETSEQEPEIVETTETTEEGAEETSEEPSEPNPEPETETEDPQVEEPETTEEETTEEQTTEEEPEDETPSIDPYTIYQFNVIKDLLISYPELNGSEATIRVRVAGQAFGTPGYCFFQDTEDAPITSSMEINNNISSFLTREDCGNNNAYYTRGDIITISGVVAYEKVTYLGATLVTIK